MQKIKAVIARYYEALAYLFFGGLATLLNIAVGLAFQSAFGTAFAAGIGNVIDNIICILFAYFTNRTWVFCSKARGAAAWKEFASFVTCRIGTAVADQIIMWLGVTVLGASLVPAGDMLLLGRAVAYEKLWYLGVKLFSQVVVIVSNYVLSKLLIFKKS